MAGSDVVDEGRRPDGRARRASEAIILAMACLAPWAFGAVDAWAQFGLDLGIVLLAVLAFFNGRESGRRPGLVTVASLALAGLVVLALLQSASLPGWVLRRVAPGTCSLRASLTPATPERVKGDDAPPVAAPASTVSQDPDATLGTAMQLASVWVLFQAVLGLGGGTASFRRFGLATAVNAALLSLFAIVQSLTWQGKIYGIRPTLTSGWMTGGPFVCHSHLAAYLNVGLGCALGLLWGSRPGETASRPAPRHRRLREASRAFFHTPKSSRTSATAGQVWAAGYGPAVLAGVILTGVIASHSRGGFLAMTAAFAATAFFLGRGTVKVVARLAAVLATVAIFLVVLGSSSPFERLATILDPNSTGYTVRREIWRNAITAWRAHPVWGTGLGTFATATFPYAQRDEDRFHSHAEDEYIQMLVEGGVVGLGLAVVALGSVARQGLRASRPARSPGDRALVIGGLFGGVALAVQCVSDFPLHIPGVAVTATILSAHLVRLGIETRKRESRAGAMAHWRLPTGLVRIAMIGLALVATTHTYRLARAEARVAGADLPLPGTWMPSVVRADTSQRDLVRAQEALEHALRDRPDWFEGHLRLGETLLGLYEQAAREWLSASGEAKEADLALLADPIWLRAVVESSRGDRATTAETVLTYEPVSRYLAPAARCFLEARRCCPVMALSHTRLASLDYLLDGSEPAQVHAERGLRLAGSDSRQIVLLAVLAVQNGQRDLAARCWKRALELGRTDWTWIADAAGGILPPEQILDEVLPAGQRSTLLFADRLYGAPEQRAMRERFLRGALARLPRDVDQRPVERLWFEAQVHARLGESADARAGMEAALASEPQQADWREEYVTWLLAWGEPEEAHRNALAGTQISPGHAGLNRALLATIDALARSEKGRQTISDGSQVRRDILHTRAGLWPDGSLGPAGKSEQRDH